MNKVAIVNRTNLKNYGSVLQVYALNKAVSNLGYESEVVWEKGNISKNFDFRPMKIISSLWKVLTHPSLWKRTVTNAKDMNARIITEKTALLFDNFVKDEILQSFYSNKELKKVAKTSEYKKFICGSDQIWCSTTLYVDPLMYLRFSPKEKRIAYAPSIGRDYIPSYNRRVMKKYISQIPCVSIREDDGKRLIKELTGRDVLVVADPTLLLDKKEYDNLKVAYPSDKKYLFCYFLDMPSEKIQQKIIKMAKENNLSIISLGFNLPLCEKECEVLYPDSGPREFLGYIEKAECVITDSYHGMLFSIIYNKQFWEIKREYKVYDQSSRQQTIMSLLGLEDRYITSDTEELSLNKKIDYEQVENKLNEFRSISVKYLKESIES